MTEEYKTAYYHILGALKFIASPGSKGQRKQVAQKALAELADIDANPMGETAEAVELGLDVKFEAAYKKGYADAKAKIEAVVAQILQAAAAGQPAPADGAPDSGAGGDWLTPIPVDPVKFVSTQVKQAMAPSVVGPATNPFWVSQSAPTWKSAQWNGKSFEFPVQVTPSQGGMVNIEAIDPSMADKSQVLDAVYEPFLDVANVGECDCPMCKPPEDDDF